MTAWTKVFPRWFGVTWCLWQKLIRTQFPLRSVGAQRRSIRSLSSLSASAVFCNVKSGWGRKKRRTAGHGQHAEREAEFTFLANQCPAVWKGQRLVGIRAAVLIWSTLSSWGPWDTHTCTHLMTLMHFPWDVKESHSEMQAFTTIIKSRFSLCAIFCHTTCDPATMLFEFLGYFRSRWCLHIENNNGKVLPHIFNHGAPEEAKSPTLMRKDATVSFFEAGIQRRMCTTLWIRCTKPR